jgi:hypothetical protein
VAVDAMLADARETRALVMTGDLNDPPEAASTPMLLGPPAPRSVRPGSPSLTVSRIGSGCRTAFGHAESELRI